jgi:hypothetical protein
VGGVGFMASGRMVSVGLMASGRVIVTLCRHDGWGGESETDEAESKCMFDFHNLNTLIFVFCVFILDSSRIRTISGARHI